MNETTVTVVGNVATRPVLRVLPSGAQVTKFRLASTSRRRDRQQDRWVDGDTIFMTVSCWRSLAANVADSLQVGHAVVVRGRLSQSSWVQDGHERVSLELDADAVGPELARATAVVTRNPRAEGAPAVPGAIPDGPRDARPDPHPVAAPDRDAWSGPLVPLPEPGPLPATPPDAPPGAAPEETAA